MECAAPDCETNHLAAILAGLEEQSSCAPRSQSSVPGVVQVWAKLLSDRLRLAMCAASWLHQDALVSAKSLEQCSVMGGGCCQGSLRR